MPASLPLQHEILDTEQALVDVSADWAALLRRSGQDLLPLTPFWTLAWWRSFAVGSPLLTHYFFLDGELVALAPMYRTVARYRGIRSSVIASASNGHSPFWDIVADAAKLGEPGLHQVVAAILANSPTEIIRFRGLPEGGLLHRLLGPKARLGQHRFGLGTGRTTPIVRIQGGWNEFFSARSRKFRKNITNKINRFKRNPDCSVKRHELSGADDPLFETLVQVSSHSWKAAEGTDLGSWSESRDFLRRMIDQLGPMGGAPVWIARLGDEPIAFELHLQYQGITYPIRADIDERHRDLSPGSVVEAMALRSLFESAAIHTYDSCAADYWYLSNWTDERRQHYDLEAFGRAIRPRLLHAGRYIVMPALRRLRAAASSKAANTPTTGEASD